MMTTYYCVCGWPVHTNITITITCPVCHRDIVCISTNVVVQKKTKIPRWVRALQLLSRHDDIGLGATAKRIASKVGGERFKRWATRLGIPCGCSDREQEWDKLYPNPNYRPPPNA